MTINQLALSILFVSTAGFSCPSPMGDSMFSDREDRNMPCMVAGTRTEPGVGGGSGRSITPGERGGGSETLCVQNVGQITTFFAGFKCGFNDISVGNLAKGEVQCNGQIKFIECVEL